MKSYKLTRQVDTFNMALGNFKSSLANPPAFPLFIDSILGRIENRLNNGIFNNKLFTRFYPDVVNKDIA